MKYETPEVKALVPAIDAIQATLGSKGIQPVSDQPFQNDSGSAAYQDWE